MDLKKDIIHLVGSNGLIGSNLSKNLNQIDCIKWSHSSKGDNYFNLYEEDSWANLLSYKPKTVLFLCWPGLPNYESDFHLTKNLPFSIKLFNELIENGTKRIVCTGTCYEYGLTSGELKEDIDTRPTTMYGLSKDCLRRFLEIKSKKYDFNYTWLRIFYLYSKFQKSSSLYPSIIRAIQEKQNLFKIGSGEEIRDFISLEEVCSYIQSILTKKNFSGIYNIGSGNPKSVYDFVNEQFKQYSYDIEIEKNTSLRRKYEPQEYWAYMDKAKKIKL